MKRAIILLAALGCGGGQKSQPTPVEGPKPIERKDGVAQRPMVEDVAPVAQGKVGKDLIPRALLFGDPERASVKISPDGKHLSWLAPSNGMLNVWVAPVGKLDQAKAITNDTTRPVRQYMWSFTNKHILQDTASRGRQT